VTPLRFIPTGFFDGGKLGASDLDGEGLGLGEGAGATRGSPETASQFEFVQLHQALDEFFW
jgi:hypothetical protein